jgi:hypothetical protein
VHCGAQKRVVALKFTCFAISAAILCDLCG